MVLNLTLDLHGIRYPGFFWWWEKVRGRRYAKASIKLPFLVQTDILNDYKFGERDGARVIYVNLRAEVRETYSSNVRSTMKLCF